MEHFAPEPVNTLKSEHLNEGVRPITACVGTYRQYGPEIQEFTEIKRTGQDVDYYADSAKLSGQGFRNAGEQTYIISTIDSKPKFTENLFECTCLVAVGTDIGAGDRNLSFLTHQDPFSFLGTEKFDYVSDLKSRLRELKKDCAVGTVDIVIVGGQVSDRYEESVKLIDSIVQEVFGFSPTVITGPKERGHDDAYFDNENRRLYVIRPENGHLYNDSFHGEDTESKVKGWKKELDHEEAERLNDALEIN